MAESKQMSEAEILRETLRLLAMRKLQPTPDNYRNLYFEVAGMPPSSPFPEREFKALQASLPRASSEQNKFARQFEAAVAKGNWESVTTAPSSWPGRASSRNGPA